jgi:hypothetical protein
VLSLVETTSQAETTTINAVTAREMLSSGSLCKRTSHANFGKFQPKEQPNGSTTQSQPATATIEGKTQLSTTPKSGLDDQLIAYSLKDI